jgi:hypothetical protein
MGGGQLGGIHTGGPRIIHAPQTVGSAGGARVTGARNGAGRVAGLHDGRGHDGRGHDGRGHDGRGHHDGRHHHHRFAGLGAFAAYPYFYDYSPYDDFYDYGDDYYDDTYDGDAAYCLQFRTYDPATGTYIGRGGRRIACP